MSDLDSILCETERIPNCPSEFKEESSKLVVFLRLVASFEYLEIHFLKITSSASVLRVFFYFLRFIILSLIVCICALVCECVRVSTIARDGQKHWIS